MNRRMRGETRGVNGVAPNEDGRRLEKTGARVVRMRNGRLDALWPITARGALL